MKRLLIIIIIGSIFSGFFLPGVLSVTTYNTDIAYAQTDDDMGPPPPPDSTTDDDGNTIVPDGTTGDGDGTSPAQQGSPIQDFQAQSRFSCNASFDAAILINCVGALFYIPFYISSAIAALAGNFLDIMIDYSTQSGSYESEFVSEGWKIIRDITNIGFIFALLYIAISTIVGQGSAKSTLVWVILMALVINFSFFATRVVIDASNILARVFYYNMNVQSDPNDPNATTKNITAALISKINIHNIMDSMDEALANEAAQNNNNDPINIAVGGIFVTIMVTIVNIVMIFVFFSIAMLFIGRVIGLWFAIIASPLAFLSIAFPNGKSKWKKVGWNAWSNDLIGTAFLAPVFLFFIYLIILFLNTGFLESLMSGGSGLISVLIGIIVPFAFFIALLTTAKTFTVSLAGTIATQVTGALNKVVGAVGGVAAGGAMVAGAVAGGAVAGVAGSAISRMGAKTLANNATKKGFMGKASRFTGSKMNSLGQGINSINWDPRNNKLTKGALNKLASESGTSMPTFGQGTSAKYGSGQGAIDLKDNIKKKYLDKKQARADELAEAVEKYGKAPGSDKTYKQNLDNAKGNESEFMSRFGHVLESLDQKIKEESVNLRIANQALQAAEKSGVPDKAGIQKAEEQLRIAEGTKDIAKISEAKKNLEAAKAKRIPDEKLLKGAQDDQAEALKKYNEAKSQKTDLTKGKAITVDGVEYSGKIKNEDGKDVSLEEIKEQIKTAQKEQTKATTEARNFYAEEIKNPTKLEVVVDVISSGGGSIGQRTEASRAVRNKAQKEQTATSKEIPLEPKSTT